MVTKFCVKMNFEHREMPKELHNTKKFSGNILIVFSGADQGFF